MGIKRESLLDPEPLHDHPADTVRKTPALIVIALEGLPRVRDILGEDPDDLCNLLRKERGAHPESPLKLPPHFHQGSQFVDHIIGGDEEVRVRLQPGIGRAVIGIIGHKGGKPGSGIDKDHASP